MTITPAPASRLDSPNMLVGAAAAVGALLMALAVLGIVDMDDTKQRQPITPAPAVFVHPDPVAP